MSLLRKSPKVVLWFLLLVFSATSTPHLIYAQNISALPAAGTLLSPSSQFSPVMLKGLRLDPNDPLKFNFIVDTGNDKADPAFLKEESQRLINYFLAVLATPEDSLWVNLSPYEHNRIIPDGLETTQIGRGMLAQDYVLKQLAASLTYPETLQGEKYWKEMSGVGANDHSPVNNLNKVWIMPKTAVVAETPKGALIIDSSLQVKMEQDNPAFRRNILPLIEKEVNQGKNFSELRQIYSAMVLATWYKVRLKEAILNKAYANREKFSGIDVANKADKEKIYQQYLKAFEVGAYNYIKRDRVGSNGYSPVSRISKRQYFSGGVTGEGLEKGDGTAVKIGATIALVGLGAAGIAAAMHSSPAEAAVLASVGANFEVAVQVQPVQRQVLDQWAKAQIESDIEIVAKDLSQYDAYRAAVERLLGYVGPESKPVVLDAIETAILDSRFTQMQVLHMLNFYVYDLRVLRLSKYRQRALAFYRAHGDGFPDVMKVVFGAALQSDVTGKPVSPADAIVYQDDSEGVEPATDDGSGEKETLDLKARKQIENDIETIAKNAKLDGASQEAVLRLLGYVGPASKPVVLDALEAAFLNGKFTEYQRVNLLLFYVDRLNVLKRAAYRQRALAFYQRHQAFFPYGWQMAFEGAMADDRTNPVGDDDSTSVKTPAPKEAKRLLNSLAGMTDPGSTINSSSYQRLAAMGDSIIDLLEQTLRNPSADTNVRKWAARLLGDVATEKSYPRIKKILEDVINDGSVKYQWWHKAEARNGLAGAEERRKSRSGEKKPSAGGGAGFDDKPVIALLKQLNIQGPAEAESSPAYRKIARMGDAVVPLLKKVAGDLSYNTDVRKWAIRLLGETTSKDNASRAVSFLRNIINSSSDTYQWWHKTEAKNAWDALYSKFPGNAPKPPTDHDFNQSIIPSLVVAFYQDKESRARAIQYIKGLIAQGRAQDALDTINSIARHGMFYMQLSDAERMELEELRSQAESVVGGVKLSGKDLNLQRVGNGGEFKFNNSVNIDFKDGARALVLEVKPVSNVAQSLGLGN